MAFVGSDPFLKNIECTSTDELFAAVDGNTGNIAFNFAMATQVQTPGPFVRQGTPASEVRGLADILVLPLANQLGPHTDMEEQAKWLEEIGLPIIGLGLGAQAPSKETSPKLKPGTERWLRTIADHRPGSAANIGVRGDFTLAELEKRGLGSAAIVTGCPSNFIDFNRNFVSDVEEKLRKAPSRIAVAAGIPFIPRLARIEANLTDLLDEEADNYIVQHDLRMLWVARDELDLLSKNHQELFRSYIRPKLSFEEFSIWCRRHAVAYFDALRWMKDLSAYDFVVGTRFHGAMLAIQAGTPAGCVTHDSRTAELCETMRIPSRDAATVGVVTRDALPDLFPFDSAGYLARREELCRNYLGIMRSAGIEMKDFLRSIVAEEAVPEA